MINKLVLVAIFILGINSSAFAQDDDKDCRVEECNHFLRIGFPGLDTYKLKDPYGRTGNFVIGLEYGFKGLIDKSIVFNLGAHNEWGDLLSLGFQGQIGPRFLKIGPGIMLTRLNIENFVKDGDNTTKTTITDYLGVFYVDATLFLGGKNGGVILKYKRGGVLGGYNGAAMDKRPMASRYDLLTLGFQANF